MDCRSLYDLWCEKVSDSELRLDLDSMAHDDAAIEDAFYRSLEFGTAGLRGVLGAGTNRMNIYTVGQATQGIANYIIGKAADEEHQKHDQLQKAEHHQNLLGTNQYRALKNLLDPNLVLA